MKSVAYVIARIKTAMVVSDWPLFGRPFTPLSAQHRGSPARAAVWLAGADLVVCIRSFDDVLLSEPETTCGP
jgi:hypothetical protein